MIDKVEYWLNLCDNDLNVAKSMLKENHYLYVGFFCHMTTEKALKAVIANKTEEVPPKIHNLTTLAKRGNIFNELSKEQLSLLDDLMPLQIEARYPEYKENVAKELNEEKCKRFLVETEEFLCWIKNKLGRLQKNTRELF